MLAQLKAKLRDAKPGEEQRWYMTKGDIAKAIESLEHGEAPQVCCPAYQCVIRQHGVVWAVFTRHFARVCFRRPDGIEYVLRYCYTKGKDTETRDTVCAFDVHGTVTPGLITLYPPRGVRKLTYSRNKDKIRGKTRKQVRDKSRVKVNGLKKQGKHKPRGYKKGSINIVKGIASDGKGRWGLGQHDSIA